MKTAVISKKEYTDLLRRQKKIEATVKNLCLFIRHETQDEVTDEYKKNLDIWSKELDEGKGKGFSSIKDLRKYFRSL